MNTVVLALQGCPVGPLGCYGNEWIATPNLDRLAAQAVVFDRHFSDAPDPASAGTAWRTGRRQTPGVATPSHPPADLVRLLKAAGTRTVLVRHGRAVNDGPAEFYADWDFKFDARPVPGDRSPQDALLRTLDRVREVTAGGTPWLLWVEVDRFVPPWDVPKDVFEAYVEGLFEDEAPYDPTEHDNSVEAEREVAPEDAVEPWADPATGWFDADDLASFQLLHTSFAAAVTTFDADFGRLWKTFEAYGWDATANLVVTADRGTPLGQHGVIGSHRPWMHEELVHLPLLIRLAEGAHGGRRVAAATQPPDLMPTLLAWHGVTPDAEADGLSLLPLCDGRAFPERVAFGGLTLNGVSEWYLRTAERHLILPGPATPDDDEPRPVALYAKPDDRWEVNDVWAHFVDEADALEAQLRSLLPGVTSPATPASR